MPRVWEPVLKGDVAHQARRIAENVATRLRDLENVDLAVRAVATQTRFSRWSQWTGFGAAQGYAGLAVLWSYLDDCFPGRGWDIVGRDHLQRAAHEAERATAPPVGLFSGLSGLAFAASQLSRGETRYTRLLSSLDAVIASQATALAINMAGPRDLTMGDFDIISGLSGVGAYLLRRSDFPVPGAALACVTKALADLTNEVNNLPRWHTPAHLLGDEEVQQDYPYGNLNCGLAHGVPGLLAFLSLAFVSGLRMPGLAEAVARSAEWLCANRLDDDWGYNWPTAVPVEEIKTPRGPSLRPGNPQSAFGGASRCAWCYGSPGIARSLWLAGEALDRDDFRQMAVSGMEAVFRRPVPVRRIDSVTFCHGVAGLLAIALRFANDTASDHLKEESKQLVRQILNEYRPESMLGFRNLEWENTEVDQPGLLDGAAGVALVLLAAGSNIEPTWDRLFLLS